MSDQWVETTLGNILTRVKRAEPVLEGGVYPAVSVTKDGQGLGDKEAFVGGKTNYARLFRVQQGDVVVRTITAFESPVGVARAEHSGSFVSQVFLTYEVLPAALPEYLALFFQTPGFWWEMQNRAQGTVLRRKTISDDAFRGIPISLPPLAVQRRIVDLLAHLDDHLAGLRAERDSLESLLGCLRDACFSTGEDSTRLGDLARVDRGASWSARQEVEVGGLPVIRIANVQPSGLDLADVRRVEGLKPRDVERSTIGPNSVLVVGSNGNPERVGNAYLSETRVEGTVLASFLIGIHAPDSTSARIIWHFLASPGCQRAITEATAGSTGLKNISIEWLRGLQLPDMESEHRISVVHQLDAAANAVVALTAEIETLTTSRSDLLRSLLSGVLMVADSYDALLDSVA